MENELLGFDAIYARQSIFKKESISIDDQIAKCIIEGKDKRPTKIYQDAGFTGANTDRPAFQTMMDDIRSGIVKRVIVWKLDRISRSVADFSTMLKVFNEYDVEFASVEEPDLKINSTGLGKVMLQITICFSEFERESIQLRTRESYYARLKLGMLSGGTAPFGFDKAECQIQGKKCHMYVEDAEKSKIVEYLYREYGDTGKSLGFLVGWLNDKGIKTNKGNFWTSNSLSILLKNPAFVRADVTIATFLQSKGVKLNDDIDLYTGTNGIYLYGNRHIKNSTKRIQKYQNMDGDYATIAPNEGLIDAELWLRVQEKLRSNKTIGSSGTGEKSWLTGLVKCGYCGKAILFNRAKGMIYVTCLGRQAKHCYERKKTLRAEVIESEVERGLLRYLKELPAKTEKMQKQHIPEINSVNIEISKIDEQIAKALSDMEFVSGVAITILGDKINALDKKKQELKRELTRLTVISQKPIHGGFDIDDVIQEWSEMTIGQKKAVAKVFIKRVTITDDTLDIDFLSNVSSTYA